MDSPDTPFAHIKGWGSDLDHAMRPGYPKERMPARLDPPVRWDEPEPQVRHVEILRSTERDGMTPVFGSGQPPRGISGGIRRFAFSYSENDLRHWLLLLLADRVDVGEGLVEDLARGHVPRVYSEMGGRAELRHNPMGAAKKGVVVVGVVAMACLWLRRKPRSR